MISKKAKVGLALAAVAALSGCAGAPKHDPLEPMNRAVHRFNKGLDEAVVRPVAKGYAAAVPAPVRQGVGNVFGNLGDVGNFANALLQGKPLESAQSLMRVAMNTVFGIGGVFDVATEAGLPKAEEDFGQTLGKWGVGPGPYLVLPVFGPSTLRDAASIPADCALNLACAELEGAELFGAVALKIEHERSLALGAEDVLEASLDEYAMLRDFHLARRASLIRDGEPEPIDWEDEEESESESAASAAPAPDAAPSEAATRESAISGECPEEAAPTNGDPAEGAPLEKP